MNFMFFDITESKFYIKKFQNGRGFQNGGQNGHQNL